MSMLAVRVEETRSTRTRERVEASRSPMLSSSSVPTSASRASRGWTLASSEVAASVLSRLATIWPITD